MLPGVLFCLLRLLSTASGAAYLPVCLSVRLDAWLYRLTARDGSGARTSGSLQQQQRRDRTLSVDDGRRQSPINERQPPLLTALLLLLLSSIRTTTTTTTRSLSVEQTS